MIRLIKKMSNHIPGFYELIVEACNRGELWGVNHLLKISTQLEIHFNLYTSYIDVLDQINHLTDPSYKVSQPAFFKLRVGSERDLLRIDSLGIALFHVLS